jgi:hypothetical protein
VYWSHNCHFRPGYSVTAFPRPSQACLPSLEYKRKRILYFYLMLHVAIGNTRAKPTMLTTLQIPCFVNSSRSLSLSNPFPKHAICFTHQSTPKLCRQEWRKRKSILFIHLRTDMTCPSKMYHPIFRQTSPAVLGLLGGGEGDQPCFRHFLLPDPTKERRQ